MTSSCTPTTLLDDLTFPEGPRWRDGRLYFSDFYDHRVVAVALDGSSETVVHVEAQPSGLGWDPQGRLCVVSMTDRRLLRQEGGELVTWADLSENAPYHCNDMVVSAEGFAYVGNFGFNRRAGEEPCGTVLQRVTPDGSVHVDAEDVMFPNGTVITPDGGTLILAETYASRLTAFRVGDEGRLADRRVWAELGTGVPDGICLDAQGGIWVADPRNKEVFRVLEGGEVTDRISTGTHGCFACMLGGPERRTLFLCTALTSGEESAELRSGRIETVEVDVPGAGLP
ncbi:MAG: SMP-30/gluconolactonase/LRE family protein [Acidobacteriota bacterium]